MSGDEKVPAVQKASPFVHAPYGVAICLMAGHRAHVKIIRRTLEQMDDPACGRRFATALHTIGRLQLEAAHAVTKALFRAGYAAEANCLVNAADGLGEALVRALNDCMSRHLP